VSTDAGGLRIGHAPPMPSDVEVEAPAIPGDGEDEVVRWRRARLLRAGYSEETARQLAELRDVDLHRAVDLVRQGCPPGLAARILA
jgi:hypothetical protein